MAGEVEIQSDGDGNATPVSLDTGQTHTLVIRCVHLTHLYHDDQPVHGAPFTIELANGKTIKGRLDDDGKADVPVLSQPKRVRFGPDRRPLRRVDQQENPDYQDLVTREDFDDFVDDRFEQT
jgi:hypothetical protein